MTPAPFADALARWASGVALLAAHDPDEGDALLTATSFTSVSAEPPLVLVGLRADSWTREVVGAAGRWAVSVLAWQQRAVAARFAEGQRPSAAVMLAGVPWRRGPATGAIVLDGALAVLECRTEEEVAAGDHVLLVGAVLGAYTGDPHRPLVRHERRYTTTGAPA